MGSFSTSREKKGASNFDELPSQNDPIYKGFGNIYEALAGYSNEAGKWVRGVKITLYTECGLTKAAINDPVANRVGFIVLNPALPFAEALDEALDGSGIEWRVSRGKVQGVDTQNQNRRN